MVVLAAHEESAENAMLQAARGGASMVGMDPVCVVWLILGWATDLCDQFAENLRDVVWSFWMGFLSGGYE